MLRSIKKAFDIIKEKDPETCVTIHTIRIWCKENISVFPIHIKRF